MARNAGIPEVAMLQPTLVPLAEAFITTHGAQKTKRLVVRGAFVTARAAVAALHARQRMWRGTVARDVLGWAGADMNAPLNDPDGVITDAKQLVSFVREKGGHLVYASMLADDLNELLEPAENAWSAAQTEAAELQQMQAELRSHGQRFLSELVRLRRLLRVTLGSHHRDYRALRAHPRGPDVEVPEIEEPETPEIATVQPAATSAAKQDSTG